MARAYREGHRDAWARLNTGPKGQDMRALPLCCDFGAAMSSYLSDRQRLLSYVQDRHNARAGAPLRMTAMSPPLHRRIEGEK